MEQIYKFRFSSWEHFCLHFDNSYKLTEIFTLDEIKIKNIDTKNIIDFEIKKIVLENKSLVLDWTNTGFLAPFFTI